MLAGRGTQLSKALPLLQLHHTGGWKADVGTDWFGALGLPGAPTSGWTAVMTALGLCREVALYGYRQPPSARGVWAWEGHDIEAEHAVWAALDGRTVTVQIQAGRAWGLGTED